MDRQQQLTDYDYGKKKKSNPLTGLDRPRGFQQVEVPIFQNNW
jgi:hypothetical protein